jgi:hypothetical protein
MAGKMKATSQGVLRLFCSFFACQVSNKLQVQRSMRQVRSATTHGGHDSVRMHMTRMSRSSEIAASTESKKRVAASTQ